MDEFFSIYSLLYLPLVASIFITTVESQKKVMRIFIVLFTLFRGLRWECGTDWDWYYHSYEVISFDNFYQLILIENTSEVKVLESGWAFVMLLCKTIFHSYTSFLLLTNFILLYSHYRFACYFTKKPIVYFALFICSANFFPVRQDVAGAIYLLSVTSLFVYKEYLFRIKHTYLYFFFNLISSLVHQASISLIPFFFVLKRIRLKFPTYLILMVGSVIFSHTLSDMVVSYIYKLSSSLGLESAGAVGRYMEGEDSWKNLANPLISFSYNMGFFYIFYKTLISNKVKLGLANVHDRSMSVNFVFINYFVLSIILFQLFSSTFPSFSRLTCFMEFATPMLFSLTYDNLQHISKKKNLLFLIAFYCLFRYIRHFTYYPELHFPYISILG